jgi:hypothetical protein
MLLTSLHCRYLSLILSAPRIPRNGDQYNLSALVIDQVRMTQPQGMCLRRAARVVPSASSAPGSVLQEAHSNQFRNFGNGNSRYGL